MAELTRKGLRAEGLGLRVVRIVAVLIALSPLSAVAQQLPPELTRPVNDFAHIIDATSASEIERRIISLKNATGDVIVVATVDTVEPYATPRDYAVKMFENHGRGIGEKGKDNGLLVLVAMKQKRVEIEVGYDLEQFITDGFSGEVSRNAIVPYIARGEAGRGLLEGVTQLASRVAQRRGVTIGDLPQTTTENRDRGGLPLSPGMIIFLIIVIIIISNMNNRSRFGPGRRRWGGGTWSGWNSGVGPFGGGGGFGGGGFGGGFGGFGGGRSGGGGGGAGW